METKTKSYTRRAVDNYRAKKDNITLTLEKGTRERLERATGENAAGYIRELVYKELERLETGNGPQDQEPKQSTENTQKSPVTWDHLAEIEKQKAEKDHAELVNAKHTEPAQHGELAKALFYHGEITQETDRTNATPDAEKVQALIDAKRAEYERNKQAEQTQADAEKTRVFNPQDYK